MVTEAERLALHDEGVASVAGALTGGGVLAGDPLGVGATAGTHERVRELSFLDQRLLQPLAGTPEGGGLFAGDLALEALQTLAASFHSTITDFTSQLCRSRNRTMLSSTLLSAPDSTLITQGWMCRTCGYVTSTLRSVRTRASGASSPLPAGGAQGLRHTIRIPRGVELTMRRRWS
jgi:hypothetical protein